MRLNILLASLLAVATLGCTGSGYYVVGEVPAPREETIVVRPGYVWVQGSWANVNRRWVWHGGEYERERPNAVYVQSHWDRRGRNNVYVHGGWRANGTVQVN
jgi:hypothetical protein